MHETLSARAEAGGAAAVRGSRDPDRDDRRTAQRIASQPFKLLTLFAQAARDRTGPVANRAIEDAYGRDARDLVRELRDALSAGRPTAPNSATGSWHAGVPVPSSSCSCPNR